MNTALSEPTLARLRPGWGARSDRLTLAGKFALAGSAVLLVGMVVIGTWVTAKIEEGVTHNSANATALYMESFVAPRVQELAFANRVTPETERVLDQLLANSELGRRIVSFKIWKEGGLIAYSSRKSIIGKRFEPTSNLRRAWTGEIRAEFDTLEDEEDALERAAGRPLLEMYSPIRSLEDGRVIAVAEFYEDAVDLKDDLFWARLQSWGVVASVTVAMLAALSGIVLQGSKTIERQREQLVARVDELSDLLDRNQELSRRLQAASYRTVEINERYLRRLGADLHDGPAQSLAFALLRLDAIRSNLADRADAREGRSEFDRVREALRDAIAEVREICAGLTLPKLDEMTIPMILKQIVGVHEHRTKTSVALDIQSFPAVVGRPIKIAMFRFVQEALTNAFRHADGCGQRVTCRFVDDVLEVAVSDNGPGFEQSEAGEGGGLGLIGMRERIGNLGGTLDLCSAPGKGTRLVMRCPVGNEG